jgi:putative ABC transport system substrate-binding protein
MDRRRFLALGAAAFAPACAGPERPKTARVVWMGGNGEYEPRVSQAFAQRGFKVGETLSLDFSDVKPGYAGSMDRYDKPKLAQIVAARPDVLVVHGSPEELLKLTRDIPIVFYDYYDDPVAMGYVASLRRPGANVTGAIIPPADLMVKQWQLMKIIRPGIRIGARIDTVERESERQARRAADSWYHGYVGRIEQWEHDAAGALNIEIRQIRIPRDAPAAAIASAVKRARAEALGVSLDRASAGWKEFVNKSPIPTFLMGAGTEAAERGNVLMGWAFDIRECERQAVSIVARILAGESPSTIPVYAIREYQFVVNRRLARDAGIQVPASVLVQAATMYDS